MKWIVGIDLRPESDGPVRMARWLRETAPDVRDTVSGVHVLEPELVASVARVVDLEDVRRQTRGAMTRVVEQAGATAVLPAPRLVEGMPAEDALGREADEQDSVLVIGRRAKSGQDRIVRLGRVARRLLRTLPCPVLVTPPDLDPSGLGAGPIIAATDAREDSRSACALAARLAERLGRKLLLAHVVPMPEGWGGSYLPRDSVARVTAELQASGEIELERWAKSEGLHGHAAVVLQGGVLARVLALADEVAAPMIVVGSHELGPVPRFFVASVGSELAAMATVPVLVVPPEG